MDSTNSDTPTALAPTTSMEVRAERRQRMKAIASTYVTGAEPPLFPYDDDDHHMWQTVMAALLPLHETYACDEYRHAAARVFTKADVDHVPQQRDVAKRLGQTSDYHILPWMCRAETDIFFRALHQRYFPATPYLRDPRTPFFSPEPDWLHEYVGHVACLGSSRVAHLYHLFGRAAAIVTNAEELRKLQALYWYSAEMGVVYEHGRWRAFGAALLSSASELENISRADIRPFDCEVVEMQPVDDSKIQPILFGAPSMDELLLALQHRLSQQASA